MYDLEKWCADFKTMVPVNEQNLNPNEATFYCLQAISYVMDKIINVGCKDLLGVSGDNNASEQAKEDSWCDVHELCRRHPELRKSNVVSRQWRLANNFPCKGAYKCRQMYYDPDVIEWINQHLRGKKC